MTAAQALARWHPRPSSRTTGLAIAGSATLAGLAVAWTARASPTILLAVVTVAGLAVIVAHRRLAVICVVGLVWANVPVVAVGDHGIPYAVGAALPLLLVVLIVRDALAHRPPVLERGAGWLAAMIFVATLSTMLSAQQGRAAATLATMLMQGALLYVLVVNVIRSDRDVRSAMWAVIAAGSWLALIAVVQGAGHFYDQPFWGFAQLDLAYANGNADTPRAFGPIGEPNYFGQLLLPVVAFALVALRFEASALPRRLAGVAVLLALAAIGYTASRGAALALVVMLAVAIGIGVLRVRHAFVAVLVGGALLMAIPGYRERVMSMAHLGSVTASAGDAAADDESARSRATEGLAALLAFQDHPIVGAGPGVFPLLYQQYAPRVGYQVLEKGRGSEAGQAPTREAHNLYLGIAADTGIFGLLAFLGLISAILVPLLVGARRLRHTRPEQAAYAAAMALALVGYLSSGLFLSLAYERYFWLLLGLAAATALLTRRALRDEAPERAEPAPTGAAAAARDARTT
jgi:putative inorganic carbon (HCO3(-)) transporter